MSYIQYIHDFCGRLCFPGAATQYFAGLAEAIEKDQALSEAFSSLLNRLFIHSAMPFDQIDTALQPFTEALRAPVESLSMLVLLCGCRHLADTYRVTSIPEAVYWDTVQDFYGKLMECWNIRGVWGTFVTSWFGDAFSLRRFGLGRFQYAIKEMEQEYRLPDGRLIPQGAPRLECHIPSAGLPLTGAVRYDSYQKAYAFFEKQRYQNLLVITCSSWLLYPAHKEMLPVYSNILHFMQDFDITGSTQMEGFKDGWRIWGKNWPLPYQDLPEDSSLQRAYKRQLMATGKTGRGYGVIVFDGSRIINRV